MADSLEQHMPNIPLTNPPTQLQVNIFTKSLVEAINIAINASTPWIKPSERARSNFNGPYKEAVTRKLHLRRKIRALERKGEEVPSELRHAQFVQRKTKALIKRNLRDDHREKVSDAAGNMTKIWKLA